MAALHRAGFANIATSQRADDGLRLRDVFIAAAVRCAPPDNKPTPDEIARCLPHLDAELAALPRVRVVVGLGKIAFDACRRLRAVSGMALKPRPVDSAQGRPRFGHGASYRMPDGRLLIGCYHPSRQNTNTGKLTAGMMDDVMGLVHSELSS
jgi:uracil-DNA glycosylase family 4